MKWLLVILLLLNICYFGFEFDRQNRMLLSKSAARLHIPTNVVELIILEKTKDRLEIGTQGRIILPNQSESKDTTSTAGLEGLPITEKISTEEKDQCIIYGPFENGYRASMLEHWLKTNGIQAQQRNKDKQEQPYFWIYLPLYESIDEAITIVDDLKNKGVKDYKLINKGDIQNAISLGIFSTRKAADKRLETLNNIGYQAVISRYYKTGSNILLDAKISNNKMSEHLNSYPRHFNSAPINCEAQPLTGKEQ